MQDNALGALQLIGAGVLLYLLCIGAYIHNRWGWVGVQYFWSRRRQLDKAVRREIEELESMTKGK